MANSDEDYRQTIASLREQAAQRQRLDLEEQARAIHDEITQSEQLAAEAAQSGDRDTALWHAEMANARQSDLNTVLTQLPPAPPQYSQRKLAWAQRNPELVNHPQFAPVAGFFHNYVTQNMGVPDDFDAYEELMSKALEPGGDYQPAATPDDLIKAINQTSKYCDPSRGGKPLTAREYNHHVRKLRGE